MEKSPLSRPSRWPARRAELLGPAIVLLGLAGAPSSHAAQGAVSRPALFATPAGAPRNVLVILADDLAQADLEEVVADGFAPNLARLAAEGWTFSPQPGVIGGFASPVCGPSRTCLRTGAWSWRDLALGCETYPLPTPPHLDLVLPLSTVTLGDVGVLAGAKTVFVGKLQAGDDPLGGPWPRSANSHGWREFYGLGGGVGNCGGTRYGGAAGGSWLYGWAANGVAGETFRTDYQPRVAEADLVAAWEAEPGSKLFQWSILLPHGPFHSPPAYSDDGVPENDFLPPGYGFSSSSGRRNYKAMIAAIDMQVGRLLARLDPATDLVFFVGDNGTPWNAMPTGHLPPYHPQYPGTYTIEGKTHASDRGTRVPFILWGGGLRANVSRRMAHLVDVLPTVCEYLGRPVPAGIDGVSLVGPVRRPHVIAGNPGDHCIRTAKYKLRYLGDGLARVERWYDCEADPLELLPIQASAVPRPIRSWMRATLDAEVP